MLDSRKLRLIVGVADLGSIAAAAAASGITASSASEQLARLENEIGADLLERSARSVRLTPAGLELVEHGRLVLEQLDAAERSAVEVAGLQAGRLRVASFATGAREYLIPSLRSFSRQHPNVRLVFSELEPEDALPALREGSVDVALVHYYVGLPPADLSGLATVPLVDDIILLAVPDRIRVTQQPAVLTDFADEPWISVRPSTGSQAHTEQVAARAGFVPDVVGRADSYSVVLDLVAAGLGLALIPQSAVEPRLGVSLVPIGEPAGLLRRILLVWRESDRASGTKELTRLIRRRFGPRET